MDLNADAEQIREIIQEEISSNEENKSIVLMNVFKRVYNEELFYCLAKQWIDHYLEKTEPPIEKWLSERYYKLLKMVMDGYRTDQNMISVWSINHRKYCCLNGRYFLALEQNEDNNEVSLYLMDTFYNEERSIQIENLKLPETHCVFIPFLKHLNGSLFMIYCNMSNRPGLLFILNMDLERMECKCISKSEVSLTGLQFLVIDESNWRNILFYEYEIEDMVVTRGRITDSNKVEIADAPIRLFSLNHEIESRDSDDVNVVKVTVDLTSGIPEEENLLQFAGPSSETETYGYYSLAIDGRWNGSKFYRFNAFGENSEAYLILTVHLKIVDIEAKTVVKRPIHFIGRIYKIHIDENETITTVIQNKRTYRIEVHRIPMREPDSLKNLALFALIRRVRECGKSFSESLSSELPDKLKPFYMVKDLL